MIRRFRWSLAAFIDTWRGESAHYKLHVADARNAALHRSQHTLRADLIDAEDDRDHYAGENVRLTEENEQMRGWLKIDAATLDQLWDES